MSLADPYLKTARAKEHLDALRQELSIFNESKPCRFHAQDDLKNQLCRVAIEISDTPDRIPLIAGEIFYCLRASLDQLIWSLAKLSQSYPEHTQFPILEKPDASRFRNQTLGVSADAVTIIESLQPYSGGNAAAVKSHLLWRLNKMCNIDKHMRIPVHSTVVDFKLPRNIMEAARFDSGGVMTIPLALKAVLKSHMNLNPDVALQVVFGDSYWGIECNLEGIEVIYEFVANRVIPQFARFF